ncbi:MAG: hypothetical protein ACP5HM_09860 [Anaerolineae bacterium]
MSDDLRDAFGEDIFLEPEEEGIEEQGEEAQNRTFLIAVAVLGGLLLLAIGVFVVWVAVLNPRMQAQQLERNAQIQATNTAIAAMVAEGGTPEEEETPPATVEEGEPEETEEPTATPTPEPTATNTPVIRETHTPTPEAEEAEEEETEIGETEEGEAEETATPTPRPRRSPTPTRTPRATSTPSSGTADTTPETGFGELVLILAGGLLIGLIVLARRLRSA